MGEAWILNDSLFQEALKSRDSKEPVRTDMKKFINNATIPINSSNRNRWSSDETEYLKKNARKKSFEDIAKLLKRKPESIVVKGYYEDLIDWKKEKIEEEVSLDETLADTPKRVDIGYVLYLSAFLLLSVLLNVSLITVIIAANCFRG